MKEADREQLYSAAIDLALSRFLPHYRDEQELEVVIGQVMTYNDPDWSVFWSRSDDNRNRPPDGTMRVGKHVGEDGDRSRLNEEIGYIVIETGSGDIGGRSYTAALGSDSIKGVGDSPAYLRKLRLN